MKNPLTPAEIEPATFRFVAQQLNHCATSVPFLSSRVLQIKSRLLPCTYRLLVIFCHAAILCLGVSNTMALFNKKRTQQS